MEIKDSIGKLNKYLSFEFAQVDNEIIELELKIVDIELKETQNVDVKMNSVNPKLVKNVTQIDPKNEDSLKDYVHGLLHPVELEIDILNLKRINTSNNGNAYPSFEQRPKPRIVTIANDTQRDTVLKKKFNLINYNVYKYLHRTRPIEQ